MKDNLENKRTEIEGDYCFQKLVFISNSLRRYVLNQFSHWVCSRNYWIICIKVLQIKKVLHFGHDDPTVANIDIQSSLISSTMHSTMIEFIKLLLNIPSYMVKTSYAYIQGIPLTFHFNMCKIDYQGDCMAFHYLCDLLSTTDASVVSDNLFK